MPASNGLIEMLESIVHSKSKGENSLIVELKVWWLGNWVNSWIDD